MLIWSQIVAVCSGTEVVQHWNKHPSLAIHSQREGVYFSLWKRSVTTEDFTERLTFGLVSGINLQEENL